jgi:hypothetical protein
MLDEVEKLDREPSCKLVMNSSSAYFCISVWDWNNFYSEARRQYI